MAEQREATVLDYHLPLRKWTVAVLDLAQRANSKGQWDTFQSALRKLRPVVPNTKGG